MTLADMQSLVHHATKKDELLGAIPTLMNDGLKQIQRQRSWSCMKAVITTTIPAGQVSIALPSNFKEPQRGKNPLKGSNPLSAVGYVPWVLVSKQELERLQMIGQTTTDRRATVFQDGGSWKIMMAGFNDGFAVAATYDVTFHLDAYAFLAKLTNATDTNYFLEEYPQMVLEKTKELVFALSGEDDDVAKAQVANQRYTDEFQRASIDDANREVAGRNFRMGGN